MNIFVIADTHFGHRSLVEGKLLDNGTRQQMAGGRHTDFASVEEHDEAMVERWNSVVCPSDKVYHLGDVCMSKKSLPIIGRLNGKKTLIAGNHDIFNTREYTPYFTNVRGSRVIGDVILTHVPVHSGELREHGGRFSGNVHGHLHRNKFSEWWNYINVCVENWDYTPVSLDEILSLLKLGLNWPHRGLFNA